MIAPLSLSNVLTVLLAIACLWTIVPQARGNSVKLWRLALPPSFASTQALVLLAGVFDATFAHDVEWLVGGIVGAMLGRMRGWTLPLDVDRARGLLRVRPSIDAHLAAIGLVILSAIDSTSATLEDPIVATDYVAAAAAFFAGYIGFRAVSIAVRVSRTSRTMPETSTPAGTSLPPS
jgi:membrane protein CcdC involved in cytochrome C biogenesis